MVIFVYGVLEGRIEERCLGMAGCATNWKKKSQGGKTHLLQLSFCFDSTIFIDFINDFFLTLFVFALNKLDLVYQMPTQCKEPKLDVIFHFEK
jgi:hypothetical protein